MNEIINEKLILPFNRIKTKKELFQKIVRAVANEKRTSNPDKLLKDLLEREKMGSTAFENGLMIPHAQTEFVDSITLVVVNFFDVDFDSIDGKKSNLAIAILVPKSSKKDHLTILSKLSMLFSDTKKLLDFKDANNKEKVKVLNNVINKKEKKNNNLENYDIVGVTSCAAGIAHTYMARDALLKAAKEMNYTIKVETRGAITENELTAKEIKSAKFVVIAADVTVSKKSFIGKKVLEVSTNTAIKDSKKVIMNIKNAKIFTGSNANKEDESDIFKLGKQKTGSELAKAIMSALSYMIPITIVGGILMAIPNALAAGGNVEGGTWKFPNEFTEALWNFGHIGLLLMVPILAMYLAYSIGGKPAMPAALIGGFFINDGALMAKFSIIELPDQLGGNASAGFLGGLAVGIIVGYMVKYMRWIKWHPWIAPVSSLMLVPLLSSFIIFIIVLFVIGSPMTWLMAQIYNGLSKLEETSIWASVGIGMLFAALIALDLGGPIGKTALVVATVIFTDTLQAGSTDFVPQTAVQSAISVPPLGMWMSTIIFRKKFSIAEISAGQAALPMGLVGITEGALPFAFRNPVKAITSNVIGGMLTGGLVTIFQIHFYGGLGSPIGAYVGYMENSYYGLAWIFSVLIGALVTALIFGFWRNRVPNYEAKLKEIKLEKKENYRKMGYETKMQIFKYNIRKLVKNIPQKIKYCANPKHWIKKPSDW